MVKILYVVKIIERLRKRMSKGGSCSGYTINSCINGNCPIEHPEVHLERGLPIVNNCNECSCFYVERHRKTGSCKGCIWRKTYVCDYICNRNCEDLEELKCRKASLKPGCFAYTIEDACHGICPVAHQAAYIKLGFPAINSCSECPFRQKNLKFNGSCKGCTWKGTYWCERHYKQFKK